MKILIIDRDEVSSVLIASRLQSNDISVVIEPSKGDAAERLEAENFDLVFADPAPMKDGQAMVMSVRRAARQYCYVTLMGEGLDRQSAAGVGANNILTKPIDPEQLKKVVESAKNLLGYSDLFADLSEDFPSAGGVIAKSAFNQLFLSSMDRGWRYVEKSYILSVSIDNYKDIKSLDGDQHASYGTSKLANHLVNLRRQSDVIGQVRENEYCLLLQRTANDTEAEEAAKRFAANLEDIDDFIPEGGNSLKLKISLIELPTGRLAYENMLFKQGSA
jgi:CheY-like chemotaxis protein